ncbi:cytochrome C [Luteibacter aegosomaticola]|uniref:cytochrome C n=1 Tax=Luteibacter aegosomaticola TaxID=2911538 RepID=UPI003CCD6159
MLPFRRRPRASGHAAWCAALMLVLSFVSHTAQAIPAYARQTGSACADCHAGAYGPALTPYGMRFKMNGYTDTDGQGTKIPVAVQLTESHVNPKTGPSDTTLSEGDLYLAGRLTDNIGGYVKVEADHTGHNTYNTRLSNVDLRYVAKELKIAGKDTIVGVTVNNSPGFTDPLSVLPNASFLAPGGATGTLLSPGAPNTLTNRVIGASVYALYDKNWYAEAGTYRSFQRGTQDDLGYSLGGDPGKLSGTGYFRFAYMKDMRTQFFSAGVVGLTTKRELPRGAPKDNINDFGYDLTYQYLGNREHIVQASYVNIYERRKYGQALLNPLVPGSLASNRGSARDQVGSVTYTFKQTYGIQVSQLKSTGDNDNVRFPPFGNPDSTINLFTLFWAPFGKDDSWITKGNLKLAATWFRVTRFNGRSSNVFGAPPGVRGTNASDLNAFTLSASIAF